MTTDVAVEGTVDDKLTPEQYKLLLYIEQYYWRRGGVPSYELLLQEGIDLDENFYFECWANKRFVDSLRGRGLPEHILVTDSGVLNGKVLTEQQMTVANVLLDTLDKRSRLKKLTELGVSTQEYSSWLKDPVYRNYCLERAESLLAENQPVAHMALIERVNQGDLGAIKYFNALNGRYAEKATAAVEVNINQDTGQDKIIAIIEIIQKHVKDPETLEAIAGDILQLRGSNVVQARPEPVRNINPFKRGIDRG